MPRFLLVHGLGLSSRIWSEITPFLEGSGNIVAVDLPGHGKSNKIDVDWESLWSEVSRYQGEQDWSDTTIVFHSFSAAILPELVANGVMPKKIIIVEGIVCFEDGSWTQKMLSYEGKEYDRWFCRFKSAADSVLKGQLVSRPPADKVRYWGDSFRVVNKQSLFLCATNLRVRLTGGHVIKALERVACPISYVFGSRSRMSKTRQLVGQLNFIKVCEVNASGHFPMIDSPQELARLIV